MPPRETNEAPSPGGTETTPPPSADLLQRLIRSSVDGILAFDRECRYTVWNPAMERISGIDASTTIGKPAFEIFPFLEEIGEDEYFYAALEGRSVVAKDRPFVIPGTGKRGFFEGHYSPLLDSAGEVVGGLGIIRDITKRKRAEQAIRDSEQRLRLALSASAMGVWEWDLRNDRLSSSDEVYQILGVEKKDSTIDYETFLSRIHPDDRRRMRTAVELALADAGSAGLDLEYRTVKDDGGVRWAHTKGRVFRGKKGEPVRMAGTVLDVTERKHLEAELLRSSRLESLGRLAGGIAHDFNNLLTVIFSSLEIAQRKVPEGSDLEGSLDEILSASERAAGLTGQLLAFARDQVVQHLPLDLNELVTEIEKLLRRLLGEDIELHMHLEPHPWRIKADRGQMEQVLVNLALNAREAMPSGGRLELETRNVTLTGDPAGEFVRLRVKDSGEGLSEEARRLAFEPFFTTKESGRGLGLASSYGILKQAGGSMRVESEPGRGATFIIDLPRTLDSDPSERPAPESANERGGETVLLVEDEPVVREHLVQGLRDHGYRVLEARNGAEAMALAKEHDGPIQVLVTDAIMPRMSGLELVEHLRAARPEVRPLVVSGYAPSLFPARNGVAVPHLQKPFTPLQLVRRVRELLDG